jgi:hypothetical protein
MSQYPPPGQPAQPAYQMQATQSNGWGLASLICGILSFCTFGTTGILAVIFGFLGMRRSKTTNSGKGISVVGLILGLLTIVGWIIFLLVGGLAMLGLAKASEPQRQANQQFIKDLASGNVTAATNDTDGMSQTEVQALVDQVKDMGAVKDVTNVGFHIVNDTADLAGIAQFDKGKRGYSVHEVKKGDAWKISSFNFDQTSAPTTTEPTTPAP